MTVTDELAELYQARDEASRKVASIEAEARAAGQALAAAREALAEFERGDGRQSDRVKVERQLSEAEARVGEPWSTRLDGARRRVRDADRAIADHVRAHFGELVEALEQDGRVAAQAINDAAADLMSAAVQWNAIAQKIAATIVVVARPGPLDVSRSRAEEAVRAVAGFVAGGGEEGPTLDRARPPWSNLLGLEDDAVEDEVADVVAVTAA